MDLNLFNVFSQVTITKRSDGLVRIGRKIIARSKYLIVGFKILSLVLILSSCLRIPLTAEYKNINPYIQNTVLVYKSYKKEKNDTLIITGINTGYRDGPTIITKNRQIMNVYAYVPSYYNNGSFLHNTSILNISMDYGILFSITLNENAVFFAEYKSSDFLNNFKLDTLNINDKTYTDVLTLYSTSPYLLYRNNELSKAYWSLTNGYIRLEKSDGEIFDLVDKYIDTTYVGSGKK